jgi:hypothetical protein
MKTNILNHSHECNKQSLTVHQMSAFPLQPTDAINIGERRSRRKGSLLIKLRRTSSGANNVPLAFEVIGERYTDSTEEVTNANPITDAADFHCIVSEDLLLLTSYYILLYSQVKRGIMTEADIAKASRKASKASLDEGHCGLRCKHCGGTTAGAYFPSCMKNLQAVPPTLHTHLLKCPSVPEDMKRALKLSKSQHKYEAPNKAPGSISLFYNRLWGRLQDLSFRGKSSSDVLARLDHIMQQCTVTTTTIIIPRPRPSVSGKSILQAVSRVVSFDEALEKSYHSSLPLSSNVGAKITDADITEEDFEIALDLLRQPPTPDSEGKFSSEAPDDINCSPFPLNGDETRVHSPIPLRIASTGEVYRANSDFVIPFAQPNTNKGKNANNDGSLAKKQKSKPFSDDDSLSRHFTRADEMNLVRCMIQHGPKWVRIWQAEPRLQHIKHSALKDRARSRRFKAILERAEADKSLLDNPDALCGSVDQSHYLREGTPALTGTSVATRPLSAEMDAETMPSMPTFDPAEEVGPADKASITDKNLNDIKPSSK